MRTAVVVCPGRGTYNREDLGYLSRNAPPGLLGRLEPVRAEAGQESLAVLDGASRFASSRHGRGDNASALIFAASLGDFLSIDRESVEIVAVTGNSMGWYSALACAGAMADAEGMHVANTMGTLMQEALIGGQTVYPHMGPDWHPEPARKADLLALVEAIDARPDHRLSLSIDLGGMLVLAGDAEGLAAFETAVPRVENRFPMRLANHAAFHSELQAPVADAGRARLPAELFGQPSIPLVDGRGMTWWPHATNAEALHRYTLGHQVTQPYDFTRAIRTAAREFAPDLFIVTGPGTSLGGAVAQSLILATWRGMTSRADFRARQETEPLLVAMGRPDQRALVTRG